MIYLPKHNLAFFHMMKCGGTSIVEWLKEVDPDCKVICGQNYHEPLANKATVLGKEFQKTRIFTLIRNPYAIMVSFYTFLKGFPREHSGDTVVAHDNDFNGFVQWYLQIAKQGRLDGPYHPRDYLRIDNKIPPNLHILHLEQCTKEIPDFLRRYDIPIQYQEVFANVSNRSQAISSYYNPYLAKLVYNTFRWCFVTGGYTSDSWSSI